MIDSHNLLIFLLATVTLNLTPGPDILYIATRSVSQGRKAGIVSALGISAGCIGHTIAAALGLSALVMISTVAYSVMKYAGAAYLIYLGIQAIRSKDVLNFDEGGKGESLFLLFRTGALTNLLNPKVAIFFLSFLPQFIDPAKSVALQSLFLGSIFIMSGTVVGVGVAVLFGHAGLVLVQKPWFDGFRRWFSGTVFIALGARLALDDSR